MDIRTLKNLLVKPYTERFRSTSRGKLTTVWYFSIHYINIYERLGEYNGSCLAAVGASRMVPILGSFDSRYDRKTQTSNNPKHGGFFDRDSSTHECTSLHNLIFVVAHESGSQFLSLWSPTSTNSVFVPRGCGLPTPMKLTADSSVVKGAGRKFLILGLLGLPRLSNGGGMHGQRSFN